MTNYHESVLVDEVIAGLHMNTGPNGPQKNGKYIDATLGNGGHAAEIIKHGGKVLGIDLDSKMIEMARSRIGQNKNFLAVHGNFSEIDTIAKENGFEKVSGIIFDLGVTNIHLKDLERGFSFENPKAELDMRIDPENQAVKASDLLNVLREDQLRNLFEETLDPGAAKWISGRVMHSRANRPIISVGDMLEICEGLKIGKKGLNEATLPFLALRIAVNSEMTNLKEALPKAFELLSPGGRLVVISFHSKEDGIVKDFIRQKSVSGEGKQITFKPITASEGEIEKNRRARSAKMRIIQK